MAVSTRATKYSEPQIDRPAIGLSKATKVMKGTRGTQTAKREFTTIKAEVTETAQDIEDIEFTKAIKAEIGKAIKAEATKIAEEDEDIEFTRAIKAEIGKAIKAEVIKAIKAEVIDTFNADEVTKTAANEVTQSAEDSEDSNAAKHSPTARVTRATRATRASKVTKATKSAKAARPTKVSKATKSKPNQANKASKAKVTTQTFKRRISPRRAVTREEMLAALRPLVDADGWEKYQYRIEMLIAHYEDTSNDEWLFMPERKNITWLLELDSSDAPEN